MARTSVSIIGGTFVLLLALPAVASAACSSEDAMNKSSEVSEVLMEKVQTKPDQASALMSEMGTIMGTGTTTEQTCLKLDDLKLRASKL